MQRVTKMRIRRKLKRQLGSRPQAHLVGVRVEEEWVTLYYRSGGLRAPRDAFVKDIHERLVSCGYVKINDTHYVNPKCTIDDLCLMGSPSFTMTPV